MFKRIEPHQIEIGMFIHKLECRWMDNPFWRSRFLLNDRRGLEKLLASDISGIVIDTARGRDVGGHAVGRPVGSPASGPATARERPLRGGGSRVLPAAPDVRRTGNFLSLPRQSLAGEFGKAVAVAQHSRRVVSRAFLRVRLGKAFRVSMVEPVIEAIFASIERNPHAFSGLMQCRQDNEPLFRHALAVSALMISLARQMALPPEQMSQAGLAGLMLDVGINRLPVDLAAFDHDVGRIPGAIFEEHVALGGELCLAASVPTPVVTAVGEHHERIDGRGFPRGLRRAEISLLGRMAAICDAYDLLANGTGTSGGLGPAAAIAAMGQEEGAFDAEIFIAFTQALGIYPIGTVLLLGSGRLAMVVDQTDGEPTLPRVVAFYSTISDHKIPPDLVDLAGRGDLIDRVDAPEAYGIVDFPVLREHLFTFACTSAGAD